MGRVIAAVRTKKMGFKKALKEFDAPKTTLGRRVQMKQELKDGAPPGTGFACQPSGWMQLSIFTEWFWHFLSYTKPSKDDPVLLIMDGHMTHIKNLDVINLARDNHVTIVILPPRCSHRMQPLDVSFMKPLNAYYVKAVETFLRNTPDRQADHLQTKCIIWRGLSKGCCSKHSHQWI